MTPDGSMIDYIHVNAIKLGPGSLQLVRRLDVGGGIHRRAPSL
jgi:hypothetical protein